MLSKLQNLFQGLRKPEPPPIRHEPLIGIPPPWVIPPAPPRKPKKKPMTITFDDDDIEAILTQYAEALGFEVKDVQCYDEDEGGVKLEVKPITVVTPQMFGKFKINKD